MSANVQCAGGGAWILDHGRVVQPMDNAQREHLAVSVPCGWTGTRSRGADWFIGEGHGVNLDKPCPRCGGKVQLIPEDTR